MGEIAHLTLDRLQENLASSETLIVFVRSAEGERRPAEGLVLRRATSEDADRYASDIGTDSADTFTRRLSDATRCYVVVGSGGTFFHATWITTKAAWTRELRAYFRPPPGDAYVFESFTRADARGKGAYPFALREICRELSAEGVARVWVAVALDNIPSLKAVAKGGFEEAWRVTYRRRLGILRIDAPRGPGASVDGHIWISRRPEG